MSETATSNESNAQFRFLNDNDGGDSPGGISQGLPQVHNSSPQAEAEIFPVSESARPSFTHPAASLNEGKAQPESGRDGGKVSNDAFLELLQVLTREFLGITPKPTSDYTDEIKALRKRFFGLNKTISSEAGLNNRFDYEKKYPRDQHGKELVDDARVWLTYLDEAEASDREKVEGWKETVDVLLVFAGLFSGVITTFVSQASQSLQQDNTQVSASLLLEISQLLRAGFTGASIVDIPKSATLTPTSPFRPSTNAFLVNGLLFTSLAITLSTALFAVLTKQWLYYYMSSIPGTARENVRARQLRLKGFELWKVGAIVDLLPILLHLAVGIFLTGIIILLFPLDVRVAWTIVIITGTTYMFYFISVILPIWYPGCPYTTSLTVYAGVLVFFLRTIFRWASMIFTRICQPRKNSNWQASWRRVSSKALHPTRRLFRYLYNVVRLALFHTLVVPIRHGVRGLGDLVSTEDFPNFTNWREENIKKAIVNAAFLDFEALGWLYKTSSNTSVHRIIARCVSVDLNLAERFKPFGRNLWRILEVNETNLADLRYGLCLDLQNDDDRYWSLLLSNPDADGSQLEEGEYRSYSHIAENVKDRNYSQILNDALSNNNLKFPLVMWRCFFSRALGDTSLVAHILTHPQTLDPFYWKYDLTHRLAYYTGVVSFESRQLGQWIFDYLFRYFYCGAKPNYSSESQSFDARHSLLVSIYRNFTSDKPLIADEEQRQEALFRLFWNFLYWLFFSKPRHISPEQYLAFHRDILSVDAFWDKSMRDDTRQYAVWCLKEIWNSVDTDAANHFFFMECDDLSPIYRWCSRDLAQDQLEITSPLVALLFMPQNHARLCTILSRDPDAISHLSQCLEKLKNFDDLHIIKREYIYPGLIDLFKSVRLTVPSEFVDPSINPGKLMVEALYSPSVVLQVWKSLVSHNLDEKGFLSVIKSRLDMKKSQELCSVMSEEAQSADAHSRDAFDASVCEFRRAISASPSQLQLNIEISAEGSIEKRDHNAEECALELNENKHESSPSILTANRIKTMFKSAWPCT